MKIFLLVAVFVPFVLCYDEAFEKMDIDKVLNNDVELQGYINCMLDKGPCDQKNSVEFKKILGEIIATSCEKCSPTFKQEVKKIVKAITDKKPDQLKEFLDKYDPTHEHEKSFGEFVMSE